MQRSYSDWSGDDLVLFVYDIYDLLSLVVIERALVDDVALFVEFDVGLTDDMLVLFPRRQIKGPRLILGLAPVCADALIGFINIVLRPLATFVYNYFFRLGFLDGREGLLLHLYHSVYVSWKYAKAWELSNAKSVAKHAPLA